MSLILKSIKYRLIIAVLGNAVRAAASFSAGVLIARGLGAQFFGDFSFLTASFNSLRPLFVLGASTAFFTFISRPVPLGAHLRIYLGWLTLQFLIVVAVVGIILPSSAYDHVWLGYSRPIVLLAFMATFMQSQAWPTVAQIGESKRETLLIQSLSITIALAHLLVIGGLTYSGLISARALFLWIIVQYVIAVFAGSYFLARRPMDAVVDPIPQESFGSVVQAYFRYCRPLVVSSVAGAAYEFGDRWMLQKFGGSRSQGLYQAAYQFAAISLFATTSILQVFWKELSDAHARGAHDRLLKLYSRVSKSVVLAGATVSGFLVPWSEEIVQAILGPGFRGSGLILGLLFIYPVHQSLGQVTGTLAFATSETATFSKVTVVFTVISLMLSYFLQAPADSMIIPGLGLGAIGLAIKTVGLNIVSVNTLGWLMARHQKWRYEWGYQVIGLGLSLLLGIGAKRLVLLVWHGSPVTIAALTGPLLIAGFMVAVGQAAVIYFYPQLIGLTRLELRNYCQSARAFAVEHLS